MPTDVDTTPIIHGRRNLILLGLIAIIAATATTAIELAIYRMSGDIYLDRSRPGYLPDEKEIEEENKANSTYTYSDTGALDAVELNTYLKELKTVKGNIDKITNPYGPEPLSDESLGIGIKDTEDTPKDQE